MWIWTCHCAIESHLTRFLLWPGWTPCDLNWNNQWMHSSRPGKSWRKYSWETFSLVLNLYNRRKCVCLHHILGLRDDGSYYILNIHFWHGFSFQTTALIFFLFFFFTLSIHFQYSELSLFFSHYFLCIAWVFVVFLLSPWSCILIRQQRAAVNKDISSLDLLATWRLS